MTDTTDRELLELAARAAGYALAAHGRKDGAFLVLANEDGDLIWNPLQDDGDALRLAVKLGLFASPELHHFLTLERFGAQEHDDYRAHRRAIVRAAASLAKEQS